jgi:hypothetical protein
MQQFERPGLLPLSLGLRAGERQLPLGISDLRTLTPE